MTDQTQQSQIDHGDLPEVPEAQSSGGGGTSTTTVEDVTEAMKDVVDPELGINVVDLGLVYDVHLDAETNLVLDMTLTSAACPLTDVITDQTESALEGLVNDVAINWVWMPPWGPDKITPGRSRAAARAGLQRLTGRTVGQTHCFLLRLRGARVISARSGRVPPANPPLEGHEHVALRAFAEQVDLVDAGAFGAGEPEPVRPDPVGVGSRLARLVGRITQARDRRLELPARPTEPEPRRAAAGEAEHLVAWGREAVGAHGDVLAVLRRRRPAVGPGP